VLIPYARNARRHRPSQIAEIAASIKEWGWTVPILIDEQDVIIAGHGRVLAAERLSIKDVPVVVARAVGPKSRSALIGWLITNSRCTRSGTRRCCASSSPSCATRASISS
jgi:ParB-like nuclease domain